MPRVHRHTGRHRATPSARRDHARGTAATARLAALGATGVITALLVNATSSSSTADPVDASVVAQTLEVRLDLSARAARSAARLQPAADDTFAASWSRQAGQDEVLDISAADAGVVPLSEVLDGLAVAAPAATAAASQALAAPGQAAEPSAAPPGLDVSSFARAGASLGLGANAQHVYSAIRAAFDVDSFSGYRRGDMDHGTGRAVDAMISSSAQGDAIAAFVLAHAKELNVKYVIWRQRIYNMDRPGWRGMANRGSATANHYDHVHVSVY